MVLDAIKYLIVDTSLSDSNVSELRTLPSQVSNTVISDGGESSVAKKPRTLSRKQKQSCADNVAPTSKRHKGLTANGNEEMRDGVIHSSTTPTLEHGTSRCSFSDVLESSITQVLSPCERIEPSQPQLLIDLNWPAPELEPSQPQLQIDLNVPSSEAKDDEQARRVLIDLNWPAPELKNDTIATNEPDEQPVVQENQTSASSKAENEEQAVVNTRRLSTRNRCPTSKALEAFASGFLTVTSRGKGKDASSSRPSQDARETT